MINFTRDHSVDDSPAAHRHVAVGHVPTGDMMEEFAAKAEKRPASFEGLPPRP